MVLPDLTDGRAHRASRRRRRQRPNIYVVDRDTMGKFSVRQQHHLPGAAGTTAGRHVVHARYFNGTVLLRLRGQPDSGVPDHQCQAGDGRDRADANSFRVSRHNAQRLGQRREQRNCLGRRKQRHPPYCTPTTRHSATNSTTATRPAAGATSSAPATSSSRRRS